MQIKIFKVVLQLKFVEKFDYTEIKNFFMVKNKQTNKQHLNNTLSKVKVKKQQIQNKYLQYISQIKY